MRIFFTLSLALLLLGTPGGAGWAATLPAGMPLTSDFAHELLGVALAGAGEGEAFEVRLDQPRLPLANQSGRATEIVVEELRYEADSGRFSALLVGTVGDQVRFRLPALGRAHGLVELPVLARRLAAGEQIAAADLDWIAVPPSRLSPTTLTEARQLIGSEARRPLVAGRVLSARDLQPARLVQRGRPVELTYARPGLQLRALGVAQADGALGELVQVINPDSQQRLQGVVVGPDRVALGGSIPPPDGEPSR
jgi:flagellar basal body P-ring formation protein FlgA